VPGSVGKTFDIYATCNLLSDNQTLWNDNYKRSTDYVHAPNVIVEWITDDFGIIFLIKKKEKKDNLKAPIIGALFFYNNPFLQ
jgi:hypothetical protein